jgi:hypothetical protein
MQSTIGWPCYMILCSSFHRQRKWAAHHHHWYNLPWPSTGSQNKSNMWRSFFLKHFQESKHQIVSRQTWLCGILVRKISSQWFERWLWSWWVGQLRLFTTPQFGTISLQKRIQGQKIGKVKTNQLLSANQNSVLNLWCFRLLAVRHLQVPSILKRDSFS